MARAGSFGVCVVVDTASLALGGCSRRSARGWRGGVPGSAEPALDEFRCVAGVDIAVDGEYGVAGV